MEKVEMTSLLLSKSYPHGHPEGVESGALTPLDFDNILLNVAYF